MGIDPAHDSRTGFKTRIAFLDTVLEDHIALSTRGKYELSLIVFAMDTSILHTSEDQEKLLNNAAAYFRQEGYDHDVARYGNKFSIALTNQTPQENQAKSEALYGGLDSIAQPFAVAVGGAICDFKNANIGTEQLLQDLEELADVAVTQKKLLRYDCN